MAKLTSQEKLILHHLANSPKLINKLDELIDNFYIKYADKAFADESIATEAFSFYVNQVKKKIFR